ncbi:STE/STE20 protein kinase [Tothia fuscella]|uniref:STE/STE20 protein kinase n=1 Tax=Tothia fuscella TaxID=1048955 RepID=A0A9P4NVU7_9PEZI|nr:STE/STE20 protein kinase [Tothia fuscella]
MSSLFKIGRILNGRLTQYEISKQIQETVWLARTLTNDNPDVIKSVRDHFRVENERDVLRRFQGRTPYLRPMIDEIKEPSEPTTIMLKYLDDDLCHASDIRTLNRKELRYVSKRILEALNTLHEDGFVHTDIKLHNILVNYAANSDSKDSNRFTDVKLADVGSSYPADHKYAKEGTTIGAPVWRSSEVMLELPWGTPTDIWSFGVYLIRLIYGGNFDIFASRGVTFDDEGFNARILLQHFKYFGPFPPKYAELFGRGEAEKELDMVIQWVFDNVPESERKPFSQVSSSEVSREDREFICKIMKLDPRDRPTAKELLQDR